MRKVLLICFLFFIACANNDLQRREKYTQDHPKTTQELKTAILQGNLVAGMTKEQVLASWGTPDKIEELATGSGEIFEHWIYHDGRKAYLSNHISAPKKATLTDWQEK